MTTRRRMNANAHLSSAYMRIQCCIIAPKSSKPGTPTFPAGTSGQCDGAYSWDLGGFVGATSAISAGDSLWVQAWYRDPGLSAGALLTEGRGPIAILP